MMKPLLSRTCMWPAGEEGTEQKEHRRKERYKELWGAQNVYSVYIVEMPRAPGGGGTSQTVTEGEGTQIFQLPGAENDGHT